MKRSMVVATTLLAAGAPFAQTVGFDTDAVGSPPTGWTCGVTGRGNPAMDCRGRRRCAEPAQLALAIGSGTFPWCVRPDAAIADGFVEVKFKPINGREDQAGGVVWRWKDGNQLLRRPAPTRWRTTSRCITQKAACARRSSTLMRQ